MTDSAQDRCLNNSAEKAPYTQSEFDRSVGDVVFISARHQQPLKPPRSEQDPFHE